MRLASVNHMMMKSGQYKGDIKSMAYLDEQRQKNQYMSVSYSGLRKHTSDRNKSQFVNKWWRWYSNLWRDDGYGRIKREYASYRLTPTCDQLNELLLTVPFATSIGLNTFFLGPLYFVSRLATVLFPAFIVLYLYVSHGVVIWNTDAIEVFQVVMISVYLVLCSVTSVLLWFNVREQYLLAHILPSESKMKRIPSQPAGQAETEIRQVTNHYYGITVIPIRRAIVIERFGVDLGSIIVSYLPNDDSFGDVGGVVKVRTVI